MGEAVAPLISQEEHDAIEAILVMPAGLTVSFDGLSVYRLEDGRYALDHGPNQRIWSTARQAAVDFCITRRVYKLGYDHVIRNEKR